MLHKLLLALATFSFTALAAEDRDTKVRSDLAQVQALGSWVYNDLDKGLAEARLTGKPLLVVLRCIP